MRVSSSTTLTTPVSGDPVQLAAKLSCIDIDIGLDVKANKGLWAWSYKRGVGRGAWHKASMLSSTFRVTLLALFTAFANGCGDTSVRTAEVDGRSVAYALTGTGRSVVLESGLGDGLEPWQQVMASGVPGARLFAYDRAGYGQSTSSSSPRDGAHLVEELRRTLQVIELPPPYLLVGHSLGGQLVLLYARLYPGEVSGIVLVDARPPTFTDRCIAELGKGECVPPASAVDQFPSAMRAEYDEATATAAQLLAAPPFPPVPGVVLSSGAGSDSAAFRDLWAYTQDELAMELLASHITIPGASHYIQRDASSDVVDAITSVLADVP